MLYGFSCPVGDFPQAPNSSNEKNKHGQSKKHDISPETSPMTSCASVLGLYLILTYKSIVWDNAVPRRLLH